MTTGLAPRPVRAGGHGGLPARRAVLRWARRMFRREWHQQLLMLALITVAVGATVVGAAVATDTPPPAGATFGTANHLATFSGGPHLAGQIASLRRQVGQVDVIENQALAVPGSIQTYDLRAQDPHGPFGQPMLSLLSGQYPAGPGQVALTPDLARTFHVAVGRVWSEGGRSWRVAGIVQNPTSLLDEFALVPPGQVAAPTQVTVLFDSSIGRAASIGPTVISRQSASSNPVNPETIVLALATLGMLLIALVAVGGFTVLAQRRLRFLGMLSSLGATDRQIRLVVRANGLLVGVAGAVIGFVLGMAAWLAYRPRLESSAHHVIGVFQVPWVVIGPALVLAVLASFLASSLPARTVTRIPVVTALAGRPAPPRGAHRSAVPGVVLVVGAAALLAYGGHFTGSGGSLEVIVGLVALVVGVIMIAPLSLAVLGRLARPAPVAVRLALRDLARYRARSGSALSAISLGVFIAALICVLAAQRYGNPLDYAGPNLASNQVIVYTVQDSHQGGPGGSGTGGTAVTPPSMTSQTATARSIAAALGTRDLITLESTDAGLQHADATGRQWDGPVYVATPQLLRTFGITSSQVQPDADILTMRPGLSGLAAMQLLHGPTGKGSPNGPQTSFPCPASTCVAGPVIQEVGALPSGTSAPNTVITEHAIRQLGLTTTTEAWLLQLPHPPTAVQITNARQAAAAEGMSIETKSSTPAASEILTWATVFGVVLALGILAMTVGLIRSETASDLRTLTATGASPRTRRTLTAVTAGALALTGAILGTLGAYVGAIGYAWANPLDGLSELSNIPLANLLILVIGMPVAAAVIGWLLAGREPPGLSRQPG
jgi:putative ABC transport system permease protein